MTMGKGQRDLFDSPRLDGQMLREGQSGCRSRICPGRRWRREQQQTAHGQRCYYQECCVPGLAWLQPAGLSVIMAQYLLRCKAHVHFIHPAPAPLGLLQTSVSCREHTHRKEFLPCRATCGTTSWESLSVPKRVRSKPREFWTA